MIDRFQLAAFIVAAIGCSDPAGSPASSPSPANVSSVGGAGGIGGGAGVAGSQGGVGGGAGAAGDSKIDAGGVGGVATMDAEATPFDADPGDGSKPTDDSATGLDVREEKNFTCTLVLGAFQTSQWYDAGFETAVGTERWEIKSAHNNWTEKWADPNNAIWNLPTTSPCATGPTRPDRVLLIVYKDMFGPPIAPTVWEPEITKDVQNIKSKYPSVRRIDLLTLARAPKNEPCPGNTSRNIVISPDIDNAIAAVADKSGGLVQVGPKYYVPDCSMFLTNITTLTDNAGALVAPALVDYYKMHP